MREDAKIAIIDYGVGNLYSLIRAFEYFGIKTRVVDNSDYLGDFCGLVLPGVGSFESGIRGIKRRNLLKGIKDFANFDKPILGICLGAQLMLSQGHEFGIFDGLDLIKGKVLMFPSLQNNEKIPHVGWNKVYRNSENLWQNTILDSVEENSDLYFVHSYFLQPDDKKNILALSNYGGFEFCSAVKEGNIYGCQFHPEKSGKAGLLIIKNFIKVVKNYEKNFR